MLKMILFSLIVSQDVSSLLIEHDVSATMADSIDYDFILIQEIVNYLCTKTTQNIQDGLKDFPTIRKMFLKYNCIRSTEAICERMFSYAGKLFNSYELLLCPMFLTCMFFYI